MSKPKHAHEEHEEHFDPMEGVPHKVRGKVQKLYHAIDTHMNQIETHHTHIDHHHHAIEKINNSSQSRHHLLGLVNRAMGRQHHPHVIKPREQHKIAKHHTKIAHHNEKIEKIHHEVDKLHHEIDRVIGKYEHREGIKRHIRQALGLHNHAGLIEEMANLQETEPMSEDILTATSQIADRLGLTAAPAYVKTQLDNPNDTNGHTFLRTPQEVAEHIKVHFSPRVESDDEDECSGRVKPGQVPAMMEYLQQKGWRTISKTLMTVVFKHPVWDISLVMDFGGRHAGRYWCY